MNDNGTMYGAGPAPTTSGYNYQGMNQPMQKHGNVLSADQIKSLQQKQQQFSLALTQEEYMRAVCNHRNVEGTGDSLVTDPETGEVTCTICGYRFRPVEPNISFDQIKEDVNRLIDILQTIKLMYIDLPADAAKDFFPIIALLEKVPQLFDFAVKNMSKHEIYNWQYSNRNMGAFNMFNNLQSMFSGGGFQGAPMYGAPNAGYGFNPQPNPYAGNPGYAFTPGMNPQAPQPNPAFGANPFGYQGASMNPQGQQTVVGGGGYSPSTNGFQFVPNQQAPQGAPTGNPQQAQPPVAAPEAPKTEGTASVTQSVTI